MGWETRECACGSSTPTGGWVAAGRDPVIRVATCTICRAARIGEVIDFARFGRPPTSGRSRNHRDGTPEVGISVYEVRDGGAQLVGWHFEITSRPEFRGRGRILGWGSDGEPLVEVIEIRRAPRR